jgi:hypothetical protein
MKLLRTTALTAALMTAAVPSLTSPAHAWGSGWRGGGWGWGGAAVGLAAGALIGSEGQWKSAVNFAKYDVERAKYRRDISEHVSASQEIHCPQVRV